MNSQNQEAIREEGGIEALIKVLFEGSQQAQAYAAGALGFLTENRENKHAIRQEEGMMVRIIQVLINALREEGQGAQADAGASLLILARSGQHQNMIREQGGIQHLIEVLREGSREAQAVAAGVLCNLAVNSQN